MSKKYFTSVFLLAFLFFTFSGVSAQKNMLTTENLDVVISDLVKTANEKIKDKTRRVTTTYTSYVDESQKPGSTYKTVWEIIPPEREHFVSESETPEGVKRYEFIRIGDKKYVRQDSGEWKEENGSGSGRGTGDGIGGIGSNIPTIERTVERKSKKGETINNQTVDLYEIVTVTKFIYPAMTFTETSTERYWFDKNGLFVKSENESQGGRNYTLSRTVREFEYDPKDLKIEAPIKP